MAAHPFDDIRALIAGLPGAGAPWFLPDEAFGRLGRIGAWLSRWQAGPRLQVRRPIVALYAGGYPDVPAAETRARLEAVAAGGAPVNALAQAIGAGLEAFDLAIERPVGDFAKGAAMSARECAATMAFGMEVMAKQPDLLVLGAVGQGGGAGNAALAKALADGAEPLESLQRLGGRETAAMAGAILAARSQGTPVLLDGFGAAAAAGVLAAVDPGAILNAMAAQAPADPVLAVLLARLGLEPVTDLGLEVGDGASGAAAAAIVRLACDLA